MCQDDALKHLFSKSHSQYNKQHLRVGFCFKTDYWPNRLLAKNGILLPQGQIRNSAGGNNYLPTASCIPESTGYLSLHLRFVM